MVELWLKDHLALYGVKNAVLAPGHGAADRRKAMDSLDMVQMAISPPDASTPCPEARSSACSWPRPGFGPGACCSSTRPTSNIDPQGKLCLFDLLSALSASITMFPRIVAWRHTAGSLQGA